MPALPSESFATRLIRRSGTHWHAYTHHRFVCGLASGELPMACFRHYLVQDYLFLVHFSRAWALAAFKAGEIEEIRACATVMHGLIHDEMRLHVDYCHQFGLSENEMAATPEEPANMAYTRFVMERGLSGDLLDLLTALAPCVVGYGDIGQRLARDPATRRDGNPYSAWITMYSGDEYGGIVEASVNQLDRVAGMRLGAVDDAHPRMAGLQATFDAATRLEIGFWDMAMQPFE
ncbi:MAG: thiaminase II [Geminicoccaceae bacterium]|nr:thiaminase II [Geminicoccaceae bacterium]